MTGKSSDGDALLHYIGVWKTACEGSVFDDVSVISEVESRPYAHILLKTLREGGTGGGNLIMICAQGLVGRTLPWAYLHSAHAHSM